MQKNKKLFKLVIILLLIFSLPVIVFFASGPLCQWHLEYERQRYLASSACDGKYYRDMDKLILEYFKEIRSLTGLIPEGLGGRFGDKIGLLTCTFRSSEQCGLERARELTLYSMNHFFEKINSHEALRPFLDEYPFSPENFEVMINFYTDKDGYYPEDCISCIFNIKNRLISNYFDPKIKNLVTFKEERLHPLSIEESQLLKQNFKRARPEKKFLFW